MPGELAGLVRFLSARKERTAMETFINGAMVIEGGLLSFLLALWRTGAGLRGLFRLLPVTSAPAVGRVVQPIQLIASRQQGNRQRDAA
jgi:hypothetical protein